MRERLVGERTALINQIRGLLSEYGIVAAQGTSSIKKLLAEIEGDTEGEIKITSQMKELCAEFYDELKDKEKRIKKCDIKIEAIANTNPVCLNFMSVLGVGALTSTILLTVLSNPSLFKNGRHFAAFLGLVPRQYSSGGKHKLYGISKRGDKYIRSLLVHGARSVLMHAKKKTDKYSQWANKLNDRAGHNRTCVAIANKNARILWALAANVAEYKADYKKSA